MDGAMSANTLLSGRTAIVSGAGGGIGRGIAQALAASGANVVIAARRAATGDATMDLIARAGGRAISVQTDVAQRGDVERAIAAALSAFGGLDIVVHNASSGLSAVPAKCEEIDDAGWNEQAGTALDAAFHLARASFRHLRDTGRGRFIVLSSAQALHGGAMNPAYAALKSAQRGFVKALAREWGPSNILVNGIAPAAETDATKAHFERHPHLRAQIYATIPLRRMGEMREDIGGAIVALCSDQMRFVTGQMIPVDGGTYTAL
jgi:NAD(P)-dependent dehydrogenase (short-subunit alcohol dehydrogenase family)